MPKTIYADYAATTPLSKAARQAMEPYFGERFGNPSSLYAFGQEAKTDLEAARADIARCLNARPEEIYFTSGGSEADNWALKGAAELRSKKGKHIITTAIEHHAVLYTAQYLEKQGYEVTYLPVDELGRVDPEAVRAAIRPDTILILSLIHIFLNSSKLSLGTLGPPEYSNFWANSISWGLLRISLENHWAPIWGSRI